MQTEETVSVVEEKPVPVVLEGDAPPAEVKTEVVEEKTDPAEEADKAKEGEDDQPRDEKGKFKSPTQARMDELTRKRHEAEREAAYWRAKANPEKPAEVSQKPTPDKFEDYNEYIEALTDWKTDQKVSEALKARDVESAQTAEQRAQQTKAETFAERQAQAKALISDYDEVMSSTEVMAQQHVIDAILDSPKGPELLYHLAKHPEEAARLSAMSVREADREIGRMEASLGQSKPQIQTKPTTNAPAPMRPAGRGAATSVTSDPAKMSHEEYRAFRSSQGARWSK